MRFSTKYTLALQILIICYLHKDEKITSNFIAAHTGADASIIRYTILDLKKKDLIVSKPGPGGTNLNCDLSKLTLYDVYELVAEPSDNLLKFYDFPDTATTIDKQIKESADVIFENIKHQIFNTMKETYVSDIYKDINLD